MAVWLAAISAGIVAPTAAADFGLITRSASARPGQVVTLLGGCGAPRIYLVPAKLAPMNGFNTYSRRPPQGRPYTLIGRMHCTGVTHPFGDGGSWNAKLRFRVPDLRPGVYQFLIYCDPCHRGPGGNLIANDWLLHGSGRPSFLRQGFRILPQKA